MANQSGYSSAQIMSMQRDAERRVNEMRRVAQNRLRQTETLLHPRQEPAGAPPPPEPEEAPAALLSAQPEPNGSLQGILERIGLDEETMLLLLLLVLLVNEGADSMLVLALVYILL